MPHFRMCLHDVRRKNFTFTYSILSLELLLQHECKNTTYNNSPEHIPIFEDQTELPGVFWSTRLHRTGHSSSVTHRDVQLFFSNFSLAVIVLSARDKECHVCLPCWRLKDVNRYRITFCLKGVQQCDILRVHTSYVLRCARLCTTLLGI